MNRFCTIVLASVASIGVTWQASPAYAELLIPNPLIKPQMITPLEAEERGGREYARTPPLPALPAANAFAAPQNDSHPALQVTDSLRASLAQYQVAVLHPDRAVLQLSRRTSFSETGATAQPSPGNAGSSTRIASLPGTQASAKKPALPGVLILKQNGTIMISGSVLRSQIVDNTVELYRIAPSVQKNKEEAHGEMPPAEELVFYGVLEASQIQAYVPDQSQLEKPDQQYRRSLAPEQTKASGISSPAMPQSTPSQ